MTAPQPVHLQPTVEFGGSVAILAFTGDKRRTAGNMIARELDVLADDMNQRHLLLDFRNMSYINSDELGTLIRLHKKLKTSGGRLTLFNLACSIYEVFEVTNLHTLFDICRKRA